MNYGDLWPGEIKNTRLSHDIKYLRNYSIKYNLTNTKVIVIDIAFDKVNCIYSQSFKVLFCDVYSVDFVMFTLYIS